ncbi:MAG: MaoC family dehydratase N-terminal domain-containing protein [Rhodoferax sp.]|uniref:FAS1-like dehydratase domain-containing protein n=1 Tax=Rhodoferax sp. TaxID=50421 RepID=UPI0026326F1D|nr:MaoC family dehydratase N-terminal domain-containing protein [Rhodoferax sp.]MDD5335830.1 MaoC family dehydratase N-terminal domain-containing protein [Rhodoferax sp.]
MCSSALNDDTRTLSTATLAHLQTWVGRTETLSDDITAAPLRALSATLDRDDALPLPGVTVLPPLWHWLYFLPRPRQSEIGPDGHAKRGGFLPPVPLPRRMWAGGRLKWLPENPLRLGDAVRRISRIESVTHKAGRSGDLLFVLVKHEVHNAKGLALTEEHDIVYRAAQAPTLGTGVSSLPPEGALAARGGPSPLGQAGDPVPMPMPIAAEQSAAWQREIVPDDVLLFRYSALTFNGHRIHYDRKYVTEVEGYPGLIVHGPLIATLLVDLLRRHAPQAFVKSFDFKALRPTFDLHPFRLMGQASSDGKSVRLWAQDHEGWLTMQGRAEIA